MRPVALDCVWLISIDSLELDQLAKTVGILSRLGQPDAPLLIDTDHAILGEYYRNLPSDGLGRKLVKKLINGNGIEYVSSARLAACEECLDTIGFDPADRKYIGVAQRTGGSYVTTEEKHLRPDVVATVWDCCRVLVVSDISSAFADPRLESAT